MLWDYGSYFISPHTVPSSIRIHGCILPTVITPVVFFSHFFYIYELEFLEETFFFPPHWFIHQVFIGIIAD